MSDTTTPKPGSTLTAAQANALPVGSQIKSGFDNLYKDHQGTWRFRDMSGCPRIGGIHGEGLGADSYTLIRVGPAAETPVETSDETPVLHIDPAAITAELDKAIPQWREEGFTVAQAIRVLRQRYEMQMQVCMYQGDSAAANGKHVQRLEEQVATLTAERDSAISEIGKSCSLMATAHAEEIDGIKADRDEARIARDEYRAAIERYRVDAGSAKIDRDAALQRAEKAEADRALLSEELKRVSSAAQQQRDELQRSFDATFGDWQGALAEARRLRTELAAAKVVVPNAIRAYARAVIETKNEYRGHVIEMAAFIRSLAADHIADAGKMVQSTHPEGSREWAEDAMRQGFSVTHQYADDVCWKDFACTDGRKWKGRGMADTGWRIHTPAVAPSAEPSVAQLQASIEALNERIVALEATQ